MDFRDAKQLGLPAGRLQLLFLAEVGGEGHHLASEFGLQPLENDRGVETAGIGENDFLGRGHGLSRDRRVFDGVYGLFARGTSYASRVARPCRA